MWSQRNRDVGGSAKFFSVMVGQESLSAYYMLNAELSLHHGYKLDDLENMLPFERMIYVSIIAENIKKKNEEMQRQLGSSGKRVETLG